MTFCEIFPPDDFPLYFYRCPNAPDLRDPRRRARPRRDPRRRTLLGDRSPACPQEPSRAATLAALRGARAGAASPCSTSTTGRCSGRPREEARALGRSRRCRYVDVAVGNLDECETAVGEREPRARPRPRCTAAGVELAIVKQGPTGVLGARRRRAVVEVPPVPVEVVNGLGAGDAFGGALCHGLLAGWDLERMLRFANAAGAIVAGAAGLRRRDADHGRGRGDCSREAVRA